VASEGHRGLVCKLQEADIKEAISRRRPVAHTKPRGASAAKAFQALVGEMFEWIAAHAAAPTREAA
jgi:hypothetical protein